MSNKIEIEHNEQRMQDVEIPLFDLEQRVEKMESSFQSYQLEMVAKLVEAVSSKFNQSMPLYLPKVYQTMEQFRIFKEMVEMKWHLKDNQNSKVDEFDPGEFQKLVFGVANLKKEMDYVQKMWSPGKLSQVDNAIKKTQSCLFEIEVMKMNSEGYAKKVDVDKLDRRFMEYAPLSMVKDFQEDLTDVVKKDEFGIAMRELEYLKKDCARLCSKEEFLTRLNTVNSDINSKLQERPTISYFKKVLSAYDTKIDNFSAALEEQMEKLDRTQADQDKEIEDLGKELTTANKTLNVKMDKNDAKVIWSHLQRFCYYDDLKELNNKFLPELAKFEQTIVDFKQENARMNEALRTFDEALLQKSSKNQIAVIMRKIDEECAHKKDQDDFIGKMEQLNENHTQQIQE